ncbi:MULTISPECIES: aspartate aminotransferase family protein [Thalassospira]|uniref:Aminotransferase class III n=2 Tax=Thalassospira TaxID=168934 RepID=A0A367WBW9_9PROT|nr:MULTISPECIES: aminotransferase class III-fold pyridoxal phosphate-dependent enzyme [Thalassospira]MDG4717674.1 aminotransferase class III-fold pyridoxal phosphate-dependent enzyme [Thalassospira sp. FZY0004]RCK38867.1 hypothetical protein TH19_03450 [Thalassospira profundimaris]
MNKSLIFANSSDLYNRASKIIPTATQTFSKSRMQFPKGKSPDFLKRGHGSHVWDVDGNEYIDFLMGLLSNLLGYADPDVNSAVVRQLEKGVSFSLATELEVELAEKIQNLMPSMEMVRFGKNGTDATSAAVRVARAATGKDGVIAIGYHGWQDWYVGATSRHKGVPQAVSELTKKVPYNDLVALEAMIARMRDNVACVILEPMSVVEPFPGYLKGIREITEKKGIVLIFDEVVTGFRLAKGGAQELFGVRPDLTAIGKGMGNGFPISAVGGRRDLMMEFENVFFSGTFGGEALSLAASIAVIDKINREDVIGNIWQKGELLRSGILAEIRKCGLDSAIKLQGVAPWQILSFDKIHSASAAEVKTFVAVGLITSGILTTGTFNMSFSHSIEDIEETVSSLARIFSALTEEAKVPGLGERLGCPLIEPVFKVRD